MKKVVSLKSLMIGILSLVIISVTTSAFATDSVLETGDNSTTTEVSSADLNQAQTIPTDTSYSTTDNSSVISSGDNTTTTSNGVNTSSAYNTVDEEDEDNLPQTGIEDYNIGILLIICVAASIYTYKKMRDYKNV